MHLKILLPDQIFAEYADVQRIVAETPDGSFGILPERLDCTAILTPGILTYETPTQGEVFVAVDEGLLVKTNSQILVSVRRAYSGVPLEELREAIATEFLSHNEQEQALRSILTKLESGFVKQFSTLSKV